MKACLLAGGPGTRLHPLTSCRPKPMMRIYDKPVLEYALASLKAAGVNECLMTLLYLPDCIRNYFGDKYDGMRLRYAVEEKPVGTAGGMLAFREALSDDDFFVVSGDAVFDLDLRSAMSIFTLLVGRFYKLRIERGELRILFLSRVFSG